jgi:hypothetical protein
MNRRSDFPDKAGRADTDKVAKAIAYRIEPSVTLAIEGGTLTGTMRRSYYGVETRPQDAFVNDRQRAVRLSVRF